MPPLQLSLAVIVRDEAPALAGLLANTADLCQERLVVDTGSRDESVAVARAAGARVIREPWRDDFARARNAALAAARGRWILVLDCDERLAAADMPRLRHLAAGATDRVYSLPQRNYTERRDLPDARPVVGTERSLAAGAPVYVEARQIRLFPNRPDLRYSGAIHEGVDRSVVAAGLTIVREEVPVHHYGHLPDAGKEISRNCLYGRLLRDKIRQYPEDAAGRYELAVQLANEGCLELAERLLIHTVRDAPGTPGVHRARLLLSRLLAGRGDLAGAARQAQLAVTERPDQPSCWIAAVTTHRAAGDHRQARRYLSQGLGLFPHEARLTMLKNQDNREMVDNTRATGSGLPSGTALANVEAKAPFDRPRLQAERT